MMKYTKYSFFLPLRMNGVVWFEDTKERESEKITTKIP
jgi:hypothetical protein